MRYSPDDLKTVDPIDAIRQNPELYTGSKTPSAELLLSLLVSDILVDDQRLVSVVRLQDWLVVASDTDWMAYNGQTPNMECFRCAIPFPEAGRNSIHCEIILAAFASDLVTFDCHRKTTILGDSPIDASEFSGRLPTWQRCIAFRVPESPKTCRTMP